MNNMLKNTPVKKQSPCGTEALVITSQKPTRKRTKPSNQFDVLNNLTY